MKTIGRYTSDAKRVFKFKKNGFRKLYCQVDGKDIYVSNSYVIFKMTLDEYDKIVRPNCDRNPGDWVIDRGGNEYASYDLKSYFESCASANNPLKRLPFAYTPNEDSLTNIYYCDKEDYSVFVNAAFVDALNPDITYLYGGKDEISTVVASCYGADPFAIILPIRAHSRAIREAIRVYLNTKG